MELPGGWPRLGTGAFGGRETEDFLPGLSVQESAKGRRSQRKLSCAANGLALCHARGRVRGPFLDGVAE